MFVNYYTLNQYVYGTFKLLGNRTCDPPEDGLYTVPVPANERWSIGEKYSYQCLDGYEPYYPYKDCMVVTCTADFEWTPEPPPSCTSK